MNLSPRTLNTLFVFALFIIVASPSVFAIMDKILGRPILRTRFAENGAPTKIGLLVHAIVFSTLYYFFLSC